MILDQIQTILYQIKSKQVPNLNDFDKQSMKSTTYLLSLPIWDRRFWYTIKKRKKKIFRRKRNNCEQKVGI